MKCPSCNTAVADDAAVCPKCDHILDPSLFSSEPPKPKSPAARKPTTTGTNKAVKRTATGTGGTGAVKKAPAAGASGSKPAAPKRMMPEAPQRRSRTPPEQKVVVEDWHAPKQSRVDPAMMQAPPSQVLDPEEAMADARNFMVSLTFSDKLAFWGAAATLFACFLPWKETAQEGESIGLLSLGALVFTANVVLIVAIIIRTRKVMPRLHALVPWLLQFGTSSFSIVWSLVLIKLAVNTQITRATVGNEEVWMSKPGAGVVLAVLTSIVALGGTLMGLREKPD
jgi:hypothetical protein